MALATHCSAKTAGFMETIQSTGMPRDQLPGDPNGTPPVIVAQPQTQTYLAGSETAFTVAAMGTVPLSYQWRFKGVNLPDATNATLSIPMSATTRSW